jgi:hypothetical protein
MDNVEARCSEVAVVATGRVVFSGPLRAGDLPGAYIPQSESGD